MILIVSNVCIFAQYTYYSHGNTLGMFTQQNYLSILMWVMSQSHCHIPTKNRKVFLATIEYKKNKKYKKYDS